MISIYGLISRSQILEKEIQDLKAVLSDAPEGILVSRSVNSGDYNYYQKIRLPDGKYKELYLGKDHFDTAVRMAYKLYAEKKLPELISEKRIIDSWIAQKRQTSEADNLLISRPGIGILLQTARFCNNDQAMKWKTSPYRRNQKYPEGLIYPTIVPGLKVRSKSEADIAARLEYFSVPYHYEELHTINGIDYAIDFTCLNVKANLIMYWDHRGMMDHPDYYRQKLSNDNAFLNAGIIPGINLIITTETKDHPLDLQWVDNLIRYFLLNADM